MSAISNIRKNLSSTGSTIIVGFIVFVLVATFGGFIGNTNLGNNQAFSVNGEDIHIGEYNLEANRISSNFNSGDISDDDLEAFTRSSIIFKELFSQKADDLGLDISEDKINDIIKKDISFYADGRFDVNIFRGLLSRLGMTTDDFRALTKSKYNALELINFFNNSVFVTNEDAKSFITTSKQKRNIRFKKINLKDVAELQTVSEKEIIDFYENNQSNFLTLKKMDLNMISISKDDFKKGLEVSNDEIKEEKEALSMSSQNSGQSRISHIQLSYDSNNKDEQLDLANEIVLKIIDSSETFNDLVLAFSDDVGSKDNFGDLGFTDGTIFPDKFENAISNLNINEISDVIDLDGSFHILKLTEKNEFTISDDEIIERLISMKAEDELQDVLNEIDENIDNLSVTEISEIYNIFSSSINGMSVTDLITSYGEVDLIEDFERGNVFLNEIYGPYESDQGYVILEPTDYFPSKLKPLEEVKDEIVNELKISSAKILLPSLINDSLVDIRSENNLESFTTYSEVDRDTSLFPQEVVSAIFSISDTNGEDSIISKVYLDDAYVIQLTDVEDFKGVITLEEIKETKDFISQALGEIERDSLYEDLRASAKIY
tara:strand:+ start:327 stop:2135 length:1809 start_codon:yes stop_codon:yes gene_type:complete